MPFPLGSLIVFPVIATPPKEPEGVPAEVIIVIPSPGSDAPGHAKLLFAITPPEITPSILKPLLCGSKNSFPEMLTQARPFKYTLSYPPTEFGKNLLFKISTPSC